tara:strand:- start:3944 stop:4369 length:426 start_codon:yes stop_codon:yes gene_type:complete
MNNPPRPLIPADNPIPIRLFPSVACGWPSPAADYEEAPLSLDELVGISACSTFLVRAKGDSMIGAGIYEGDVLIVDRSVNEQIGHIIIAIVDGDFTVKRFGRVDGQLALLPENPAYKPLLASEGEEVQIWGVVTWNLHRLS